MKEWMKIWMAGLSIHSIPRTISKNPLGSAVTSGMVEETAIGALESSIIFFFFFASDFGE